MFIYGNSEWTSSPYASANTDKYYPSSIFDEEVEMNMGNPDIQANSMRCIDWEDYWGGFNGTTAMFYGNSQPTYIWTNSSNVTTDNRLIKCNAFKSTECKCCNGLPNVMNNAKINGTNNAKKFRINPSTKLPTLTQLSNISAVLPTKLNTSNKYVLLSEIVPIGTHSKYEDYGLGLEISFSNSSSGVYIRLGNRYSSTFQYEFCITNITFGFDMSFTCEKSEDETLYAEDFEWLVQNVFNGTTTGSSYTYSYSYAGPALGNGILSFSATESEIIRYANDVTIDHLDPLLRNYVNSTKNTIFTNNAGVSLPYLFDYFTQFDVGALLFGVCLYKLRTHSASRYATNGNYNNYYGDAQGGDLRPEVTGLDGECISLMFKSVGAAGYVIFNFLLRSISFEISPFKNFYLELTPLHISGSSSPYTIDNWTIVPARNIRTFTNASEITISINSSQTFWQGDGPTAFWVKPNIYITYNNGSVCDLTPISGQNKTSQTITINGAGHSSIPVMLYKSPQITS